MGLWLSRARRLRAVAYTPSLLKNDGVLPFSSKLRRIGVFGADADYPTTMSGCGSDLFCTEGPGPKHTHWNGSVTVGGGSCAAYATYIVPPIEAIARRGREARMRLDQVLRNDAEHYPAIRRVAASVEVCLVSVAVFLVEGRDRPTLRLDDGGEALILEVAKACAGDVVVVIHAGGQVVMEDWINHPKVKAVIWAGYPGQESGNALANILWGDVNPSGKLAFTLGKRESDWPKHNIIRKKVRWIMRTKLTLQTKHLRSYFSEGLAIDYKWFDKHDIEPRYEFGFGLSYTSFSMAELAVEERHIPNKDTVQPTNEKHEGEHDLYDTVYVARVAVTNTGEREGKEVAQLVSTMDGGVPRRSRTHHRFPISPDAV